MKLTSWKQLPLLSAVTFTFVCCTDSGFSALRPGTWITAQCPLLKLGVTALHPLLVTLSTFTRLQFNNIRKVSVHHKKCFQTFIVAAWGEIKWNDKLSVMMISFLTVSRAAQQTETHERKKLHSCWCPLRIHLTDGGSMWRSFTGNWFLKHFRFRGLMLALSVQIFQNKSSIATYFSYDSSQVPSLHHSTKLEVCISLVGLGDSSWQKLTMCLNSVSFQSWWREHEFISQECQRCLTQEEDRKTDGEKENEDDVKILSVDIHTAQSGWWWTEFIQRVQSPTHNIQKVPGQNRTRVHQKPSDTHTHTHTQNKHTYKPVTHTKYTHTHKTTHVHINTNPSHTHKTLWHTHKTRKTNIHNTHRRTQSNPQPEAATVPVQTFQNKSITTRSAATIGWVLAHSEERSKETQIWPLLNAVVSHIIQGRK